MLERTVVNCLKLPVAEKQIRPSPDKKVQVNFCYR